LDGLLNILNGLLNNLLDLLNDRLRTTNRDLTGNLNFDGIRDINVLFYRDVDANFNRNRDVDANFNGTFSLNSNRVWNILFKRNLNNAFDGVDNIIGNLNLGNDFLVFWVRNIDLDDDFNLDFDGIGDRDLNLDRVRNHLFNLNWVRDVNGNVTCYLNGVRTRYRYLNINVSGSLHCVGNLDIHSVRDVNGNLDGSSRDINDSFNRVWDIDSNLNFPRDSNTNRDGYFLVKVLVHFNVVRGIYAHFDRYGYIDRYIDVVRNAD